MQRWLWGELQTHCDLRASQLRGRVAKLLVYRRKILSRERKRIAQ